MKGKSDADKLRELSEVLLEYDLTAAELCEDDKKYRVEKTPTGTANEISCDAAPGSALEENEQLHTIISPVVGVFHESHSDGEPPLMKLGQCFQPGDVLCVLEAMKTFTEVRADDAGIIEEVCAKNGDLIEFSQVLFKYKKQ